jgi:PEP-CTERM motif
MKTTFAALLGLSLAASATAADLRVLTVYGFDPGPVRYYTASGYVFMPPAIATITAVVDWESITQSFNTSGDTWTGIATGASVTYSENGAAIFTREASVLFQVVNRSDSAQPEGDIVRVNFDFYIEPYHYRDSYFESWLTLPYTTLSSPGLTTLEEVLTDYSTYSALLTDELFFSSIGVYEEGNPFAVYTYVANANLTGYSLTAIPEPSSYAGVLGLFSIGMVGLRRRRRRG